MTIAEWLTNAARQLKEVGITNTKLEAELLLAHSLDKDRTFLIANQKDALPENIIQSTNRALNRRLANEPMAFILGHKEFYGLRFKTDKRALIPRWESETLVEAGLAWLKERQKQTVVEVGTGCGAIITAMAHHAPQHAFMATDISQDALELAQENAATVKATITFKQGDLAAPLLPEYQANTNLLVANLPYIPSGLLINLDPTIRYYEPNIALDGGSDGLELYRQFMPQAKELLTSPGLLLCEHEFDQGEAMRTLAHDYFPNADIKTLKDHLGHDRVLYCELIG